MSLILSGTDGLSDVDGSAATPAIRGTDANTGIFFPAADTIAFAEGGAEVMRIDSDGDVGIGTTTPNSKLTSQTASTSTSVFSFATQLNNSFASNSSISALGFHVRADVNATGVGGAIAFSGGGVSDGSGNLVFCVKPTGNIATVVAPSDEKMRIDSSGNVGIGVTPTYKLQVSPGTYSDQLAVFNEASTWTANGGLVIADYYNATTLIGGIKISAASGTSGYLSFHTGGTTERMRIDTNGNLAIGTTSTTIAGDSGKIMVDAASGLGLLANRTGDGNIVRWYRTNSQVGSISVTSSATAYNTSSDYRLKNTIAPMTGALAKVALLKPVTYKWKLDNSDGEGFIAHELQAVVPDCVTGEKDAVETYADEDGNEQTRPKYQGIDTSFLVATLTAAIQEQQALITALTARITALETPAPSTGTQA
jgi:hypothetical protein